ncbi:MAG: hypothetical protein C5B53_05715, partial [Candidatus Melainabacteria bacterium]
MIKSIVSKLYKHGAGVSNATTDNSQIQASSELANSGLFDQDFYSIQVAETLTGWDAAILHYLQTGAKQYLDPHPLFDSAYYVETNDDIDFAAINPLLHFLRQGWKEGRNPHPLLDVRFYLQKYKDVEQLGIDPLSHYLFAGAKEGRDPSPFFSSAFYLKQLNAEELNPLVHFVVCGAHQGLLPHPQFTRLYRVKSVKEGKAANQSSAVHIAKFESLHQTQEKKNRRQTQSFAASVEILDSSKLFDDQFVRLQTGMQEISRIEAVIGYLTGAFAARPEPHFLFDTQFYMENNQDIDFEKSNPFIHFLTVGWKELRNPHPLFDIDFYLKQCPDVQKARLNPLQHFMLSGARERRNPCRAFDSNYYLKEIVSSEKDEPVNPLLHFLTKGAKAKLMPHPLFELIYQIMDAGVSSRAGEPSQSPAKIGLKSEAVLEKRFSPAEIESLFQIYEGQLFDHEFYLAQLGREDLNWLDCVTRYIECWSKEEFDPHPLFDTAFYVKSNADVDFRENNPLLHFCLDGWAQGRNPHPLFDIEYYRMRNRDVRVSKRNPVIHFMQLGGLERRVFSPLFDYLQYEKLVRKTTLRQFFREHSFTSKKSSYCFNFKATDIETSRLKRPANLLVHFLTSGAAMGLSPSPNFGQFFELKPRVMKAGNDFWKVEPKSAETILASPGTFASIARRLVDAKLSREEYFKLAKLMNCLTLRKSEKGFLEGTATIFLATHEASRTGAPLLLLQMIREFAAHGWECVVLIDKEGAVEDEFARYAHVINFRGVATRYSDCQMYLDILFNILKFPKPKLCLLNSLETGRFAKPFANHGIKIITFVHEMADAYPVPYLKDIFQKSQLVVFPAKCVQELSKTRSKMPSLPDMIIPSALLDDDFGAYDRSEAYAQIRKEIGASDHSQLVLACGSPDMRKGIDIFVSVAQMILKNLPAEREVHFVWIGAGQMLPHTPLYYARWQIRQAGLAARVHLLPPRKNLVPAFRGSDLFVLTSRQDPFPCV